MSVTSPRAASDFHHCRHLKCRARKCSGGCTHWNPRQLLWKKIKHDILSVSKSVAWYQIYMHIKACLVTGYSPKVSRQVTMMFIPLVYCPSCGKWCKNSRPGTTQLKQWGMFPTSVTICLQTREVLINHNAPGVYTYTGGSGNQEVTLELFRDIKKASDSTSHDITHVAKWHGLGNTLQWWFGSMLGRRKIKATLTGETVKGSVAKCCSQRGSLPHSCEAWLKTNP